MKVLFAGESWKIRTTNSMGFDSLSIEQKYNAGDIIINAIKDFGVDLTYISSDDAHLHYPDTIKELQQYDVLILSDIGSNSFLLHPDTQYRCIKRPNRLKLIQQYVREGGGLLMCGGYMSYSGFEGKARYSMTALADVLPVEILHYDDRVECPEGIQPIIMNPEHEVLKQITGIWPEFLGYNKLKAKKQASVIAKFDQDDFMVCWDYEKGRAYAFASDCVPHWGSYDFVNWDKYGLLWNNILLWLSKKK